jgi:hypothetical protein
VIGSTSRYAVLFRVHFWDDFAERQYQRLRAKARNADLFILVNETDGTVPIPHRNKVSFTEKDLLALGLSGAGYNGMVWYNGDYPLYYFYERYPDYDYYIVSDYDVLVQRDLDDVVDRLAREYIDYVGLTRAGEFSTWPHTHTVRGVYPEEMIQKQLICLVMYSNRCVRRLLERRRELSQMYSAGQLDAWPYCEAFIPTEVAMAGLKAEELTRFGPCDHCHAGPAILESDLARHAEQGFVHPVLDASRFVERTFTRLSDVRKLRRVPVRFFARPLGRMFWQRVTARVSKLGDVAGKFYRRRRLKTLANR